jgi:hypothetical protein
MFRRVALVKTDVSKESSASFIRMTRIGELGTTLAVTINQNAFCWMLRRVVLARAEFLSNASPPSSG